MGKTIYSELSWKHHIDVICHKISRTVGIIAKLRHLLLNLYHALSTPNLIYGICAWGKRAQTYLNKLLVLWKNVHCVLYILQNPETMQILFFFYLIKLPSSKIFILSTVTLFNVWRRRQDRSEKTSSISLRKSVQNLIIIRDYLQRNVSLSNSDPQWKKEREKVFNWTRVGVSMHVEFYFTLCSNSQQI